MSQQVSEVEFRDSLGVYPKGPNKLGNLEIEGF